MFSSFCNFSKNIIISISICVGTREEKERNRGVVWGFWLERCWVYLLFLFYSSIWMNRNRTKEKNWSSQCGGGVIVDSWWLWKKGWWLFILWSSSLSSVLDSTSIEVMLFDHWFCLFCILYFCFSLSMSNLVWFFSIYVSQIWRTCL